MKVSLSGTYLRFQVQGKSRGRCVCRWPVAGLQQHGRTRIWRAPIPCSRRLQHHPNPWILGIQTPSTLQHLVGRCMLQLPRLHTKGRTCVDSSYFVCNLRYTRLAPLFGVVNTPPTHITAFHSHSGHARAAVQKLRYVTTNGFPFNDFRDHHISTSTAHGRRRAPSNGHWRG